MLLFVLLVAAIYDAGQHRIPNWWILSSASVGILLSILGLSGELTLALAGKAAGGFLLRFVSVAVGGFILYRFRMIGAGDIKLAGLICGYLGFGRGLPALGWGMVIGAVFSFLKMAVQGSLVQRFTYFFDYVNRVRVTGTIPAYYDRKRDGTGAVIPLGICFFAGTAVSFICSGR